jgi:hypothetical protein
MYKVTGLFHTFMFIPAFTANSIHYLVVRQGIEESAESILNYVAFNKENLNDRKT